MPRAVRITLAALGLSALGLTAGCSSVARTPTPSGTRITPTAQVVVGCPPGLGCTTRGPAVTGGAPAPVAVYSTGARPTIVRSVPDGSTVTVANQASGTHRLTGTVKDSQVFDTGQLRRGESTLVTLQTPGLVQIVDTTTGQRTTLTVRDTTTTTASS